MDIFFKSVYCLSGLGIVKKNRRIPKYFNDKKAFDSRRTHCFYIEICSFFTILSPRGLSTSGVITRFEKNIIHGADLTN